MFFGPKITTVFRSRWKALAWAAGVLFSAYCFIPSPGEDNDAGGADAAKMAAPLLGTLGAATPAPAPAPASPWAPDAPQQPAPSPTASH